MADARARIREGVERLGIDLRYALGAEVVDQVTHGASRGETRVDPTAKTDDGKRPPQVLRVEVLELPQKAVVVAHGRSIERLAHAHFVKWGLTLWLEERCEAMMEA